MDGDYSVTNNYFVVPNRGSTIKKWGVRIAIALVVYQFVPGVKPVVNGLWRGAKLAHCTATAPIYRKPLCLIPRMPWQREQSTIDRLREAIIGKESGGDSSAVNPHSGALGLGQVMPANVASWTMEALGRSLTPEEFLADEDAQLKTINHKLEEYLEYALSKGLNEDEAVACVAAKWYSGQCDLRTNTSPQTYGEGDYPSIAGYSGDIVARFHAAGEGEGDIGTRALGLLSVDGLWKSFSSGLGDALVFPVAGTDYAKNEQAYPNGNHDFGMRTFNGKPDNHQGYDIDCAVGQPLIASIPGVIRYYDDDPGGWGPGAFWIESESGAIHIYGHGDRLAYDGQKVADGDVVGGCNSKGRSTGPHLHYEIRPNGLDSEPIDPEPYFK